MRILQERNRIGWTQNRPIRNTPITTQTGSNNKNRYTLKRKRTKMFSWGKTVPFEIYEKNFSANTDIPKNCCRTITKGTGQKNRRMHSTN